MYTKRTEQYDAECFIVKGEDIPFIKNIMISNILENNEHLVELIEKSFAENDEEKFNKSNLLLNAQISKKTFDGLKKQTQFKKINVIIYNELRTYEHILEDVSISYKELQDANKLLTEIERKLRKNPNIDDLNIGDKKYPNLSREVSNFLKQSDYYANFRMLTTLDLNRSMFERKESEMNAVVGAGVKWLDHGLTIDDILKGVDVAFRRYEIDFENETLNIYNSYAKMSVSKPKDFKPWYGDLHEELENTRTFKECKKEMIEEYNVFVDPETIFKELTLGGVDSYTSKEQFEEAIEKEYGKCPIDQLTPLSQAINRKLVDPKILGAIGLILENNLIKKEVERTRVLKKNNASKKKNKGGSMYKSIVKEWYVYDEKRINEMANNIGNSDDEGSAETYIHRIYAIHQKNNERKAIEDVEYQKEEWEVKPHVRTLKDGRKVLISSQKRKRRKELLENEKTEPNVKTYGMPPTDVEKIVKNATKK